MAAAVYFEKLTEDEHLVTYGYGSGSSARTSPTSSSSTRARSDRWALQRGRR
jgi:hypothetical protein